MFIRFDHWIWDKSLRPWTADEKKKVAHWNMKVVKHGLVTNLDATLNTKHKYFFKIQMNAHLDEHWWKIRLWRIKRCSKGQNTKDHQDTHTHTHADGWLDGWIWFVHVDANATHWQVSWRTVPAWMWLYKCGGGGAERCWKRNREKREGQKKISRRTKTSGRGWFG